MPLPVIRNTYDINRLAFNPEFFLSKKFTRNNLYGKFKVMIFF